MTKLDSVKEKYTIQGISLDNIEFAIDAVKEGTKREIIIESLTADYRGLSFDKSTNLLDDLFAATGGEFKKENRGGYLFGSLFLLVGFACLLILIMLLKDGEVSKIGKLIALGIVAVGAILVGIKYLLKSLKGKFREDDEPFKD
jgi:hypothetical protein